jgi:FkbM family methyltransferase
MSFVSFAQNFEDVMLWRALKGVERGFYVDVGAFSATFDSVTRAFYERGWRGVNVEPNPHYYNELVQHRPRDVNLRQAVSDVTGNAEMYLVPNSGLSSLDEAVARDHESLGWSVIPAEVELTTLATIWASHVPAGQDVHFLKVDVEGAEEAVLRGNDWGRNRPWIVIVEATKPSSQVESYLSWEPLLTLANYTFVYADGLNRFYVAAEQKHLAEAFRYPPNVFDGLIRLHEYQAETRAAAAENAREQFAAQAAAADKARDQFAARAAAADKARDQFAARAAAADKAREQLGAQAAEEVVAHAEVLARARDNIDALQDKVTTLSEKLARAESVIDYVTQQKLIERMFFRPDGRPAKPLRRLLFHTSGKPRRLFRRVVLHKDATPRQAFARWMRNESYFANTMTQQAARLAAERDALRGDVNRLPGNVRGLEARLAAPRQSSSRGFARRMEKRVLRPILHGLRSALTGRRRRQPPQPQQQTEVLSSVPPPLLSSPTQPSYPFPPQYDILSEMRRLATVMENTLLTLAMERGADGWPAAAPVPSEPALTTRERRQPDPAVQLDGVRGPAEGREGLGGSGLSAQDSRGAEPRI